MLDKVLILDRYSLLEAELLLDLLLPVSLYQTRNITAIIDEAKERGPEGSRVIQHERVVCTFRPSNVNVNKHLTMVRDALYINIKVFFSIDKIFLLFSWSF